MLSAKSSRSLSTKAQHPIPCFIVNASAIITNIYAGLNKKFNSALVYLIIPGIILGIYKKAKPTGVNNAMSSWTQTWVNDYLDLYNYAKTIGDSAWAEDLLRKLRDQKDIMLEEERKVRLLRELLANYDRINNQLLEIFNKLRGASEGSQAESLQEQWLKLKLMRIDVSRKILQYI